MKRFIVLAALAAGLVTAPPAVAQDDGQMVAPVPCRTTIVGEIVDVRHCASNTSSTSGASTDPDVSVTCQINKPINLNVACSFAPFVDDAVSNFGRTGFVPNAGFPAPNIYGSSVSHPGGTVGWLYLNGGYAPVEAPPFCSGSTSFCGTGAWVVAVVT